VRFAIGGLHTATPDLAVLALLDIDRDGPAYREVPASYFSNQSALPASTLLQVSRLANPEYLLEVEALAILPPKA
jgi:enamine deaminase RidA (YjgF/YER057c/UK114 family)